MKRNILWMGMLVMVLAFGMTVVGCGDGSTDDNGGNGGGSNITLRVLNNWDRPIVRVRVTQEDKPILSEYLVFDSGEVYITTDQSQTFSVNLKGFSKIRIWITAYAYLSGDLLGNNDVDVNNVAPGQKYLVKFNSTKLPVVTKE